MGKILSLLIGAVVTVVGLILLIAWWYEFLFVLRGVMPVIIAIAGVLAVLAGFGEFKDVFLKKKK